MGFNIWANGRNNFRYEKKDLLDGSEFDAMQTLAIAQTLRLTKTGLVDAALQKYASKGVADGAVSVATKEMLNMLVGSVDALALAVRGTGASINVRSTQKKALWADAARFVSYDFSPGDNPGVEFFRALSPCLVDTDMASWGVLMGLAVVIAQYSAHLSKNPATPWIMIELWKKSAF